LFQFNCLPFRRAISFSIYFLGRLAATPSAVRLYELKCNKHKDEAFVDALAKIIISAQKQLEGTQYAGH
jgi:hypothetical protein